MHIRHYQNLETKWCRYSDTARRHGVGLQRPYRIGRLLRYGTPRWPANRPPYAVVIWNGNKTTYTYAREFIEVFAVSNGVVPGIPELPVIEHLLRSKAWHS